MTRPKCNMSHVHACTILARLCSWGCTYFPGGFLVGRVLMKNNHLNEILTVNNWQLSFWILGESVLLRITTTCKCSQEAPQSLKNSSAIHCWSLLYMQCTCHIMPRCALSMNGFRRRKFTTSALMTPVSSKEKDFRVWTTKIQLSVHRLSRKEREKLSTNIATLPGI